MPKIRNTLAADANLPEDAEATTSKRTRNSPRADSPSTKTKKREVKKERNTTRREAKRTTSRNSTRDASRDKPRGESRQRNRGNKLPITISLGMHSETKNKVRFIELDADGDQVENPFRDGVIGQIYLPKTHAEGIKQITVTVTAE